MLQITEVTQQQSTESYTFKNIFDKKISLIGIFTPLKKKPAAIFKLYYFFLFVIINIF